MLQSRYQGSLGQAWVLGDYPAKIRTPHIVQCVRRHKTAWFLEVVHLRLPILRAPYIYWCWLYTIADGLIVVRVKQVDIRVINAPL